MKTTLEFNDTQKEHLLYAERAQALESDANVSETIRALARDKRVAIRRAGFNGYSGIAWCALGKFDRPWGERKIDLWQATVYEWSERGAESRRRGVHHGRGALPK